MDTFYLRLWTPLSSNKVSDQIRIQSQRSICGSDGEIYQTTSGKSRNVIYLIGMIADLFWIDRASWCLMGYSAMPRLFNYEFQNLNNNQLGILRNSEEVAKLFSNLIFQKTSVDVVHFLRVLRGAGYDTVAYGHATSDYVNGNPKIPGFPTFLKVFLRLPGKKKV